MTAMAVVIGTVVFMAAGVGIVMFASSRSMLAVVTLVTVIVVLVA